ncbi:purine-cytosine permease family protein [Nocardia fluminea]|uniref:purine-cytosine permease family protein n=1 Tax=Nocardia fluminea TaxID=134984 RepID=UPI00379F8379
MSRSQPRRRTEDLAGRVEKVGVECLPEQARDSSPRNLGAVFIGANVGWLSVVIGTFPITFGLTFWESTTAAIVGCGLGTLAITPLAMIGTRTGTNMTVASGAHFGIRGRFVGTLLSLLIAIAFGAMTAWTSGDALVATANRVFGLPVNDLTHAVGYALIAVVMIAVALYGHGTVVAMQKVAIPVAGIALLFGVFAFRDGFDPGFSTGTYALDGFWPTWMLAAALAASAPISYGPQIGDYTRRISRLRYSDTKVMSALGVSMFLGCVVPASAGTFIAVSIADTGTGDYIADIVTAAPGWFVPAIVILSMFSGLSQGTLCVYASGLDLEGLMPRLTRVQTTLIAATSAVAVLYIGVFVFDAVESVTAFSVLLTAVCGPWVAILAIEALRHRTRDYDQHDLQAYAQRRRGGRYWFTGGWHIPALLAWLVGSGFGLLTVNTTLYRGPLADLGAGIDLSVVGSALVAAAVYGGVMALSRSRIIVGDPAEPTVVTA